MPASRFDPRLVRCQRRVVMAVLVLLASACSAGRSSTSADSSGPPGTAEAEWRVLATPRVAPMTGAVRISVGEIVLIDQDPWGLDATVGSAMGLSELVAAGLLRRPDVHFVEQRRFAAAAEAEHRGEHPPGAPRG